MNNEIEKIIVDILMHELGIEENRIFIANQDFQIPDSEGLFISVGMSDCVTIANNNYALDNITTGGIDEIQEVYLRENITIDLFSKNIEARQRRWEIQAALKSIYAQQKQELEYFRIYRIPSGFVNSSEAEGGSRINRFTITIPCNTWYRKTKTADFYDRFPARVDDEKTIETENGLIEFTIEAEE